MGYWRPILNVQRAKERCHAMYERALRDHVFFRFAPPETETAMASDFLQHAADQQQRQNTQIAGGDEPISSSRRQAKGKSNATDRRLAEAAEVLVKISSSDTGTNDDDDDDDFAPTGSTGIDLVRRAVQDNHAPQQISGSNRSSRVRIMDCASPETPPIDQGFGGTTLAPAGNAISTVPNKNNKVITLIGGVKSLLTQTTSAPSERASDRYLDSASESSPLEMGVSAQPARQ